LRTKRRAAIASVSGHTGSGDGFDNAIGSNAPDHIIRGIAED
jgi:hypothetical protein